MATQPPPTPAQIATTVGQAIDIFDAALAVLETWPHPRRVLELTAHPDAGADHDRAVQQLTAALEAAGLL